MKLFLPYHLGSGNRGCEGISRGIIKIVGLDAESVVINATCVYDFESDKRLGINRIGDLTFGGGFVFNILLFVGKVLRKCGSSYFYNTYISRYYLRDVKKADYVFITGGDIYCYKNCYKLPNKIALEAKRKGAITVLFGVSMEKKFLSKEVVSGLRNFDLITSREKLSSEVLTSVGLENSLYPDPAFVLDAVYCELPEYFNCGDVVGINISSFTNQSGLFKKNIEILVEYIAMKNMTVCLIPHVFWKNQDDREVINELEELLGFNVFVLDSEKLSYQQIRYVISNCRFFIGARTHSVISAYSTQTPCIALGYSIKSVGIACDVGMPDYTLVDSKKIKTKYDIVNAFKELEYNEEKIRCIMENIPQYIDEAYNVKKKIMELADK